MPNVRVHAMHNNIMLLKITILMYDMDRNTHTLTEIQYGPYAEVLSKY